MSKAFSKERVPTKARSSCFHFLLDFSLGFQPWIANYNAFPRGKGAQSKGLQPFPKRHSFRKLVLGFCAKGFRKKGEFVFCFPSFVELVREMQGIKHGMTSEEAIHPIIYIYIHIYTHIIHIYIYSRIPRFIPFLIPYRTRWRPGLPTFRCQCHHRSNRSPLPHICGKAKEATRRLDPFRSLSLFFAFCQLPPYKRSQVVCGSKLNSWEHAGVSPPFYLPVAILEPCLSHTQVSPRPSRSEPEVTSTWPAPSSSRSSPPAEWPSP